MVDDDGRTADGRTDGRTPDHGHPISSPCEPNGSGELTMWFPTRFDTNRPVQSQKMAGDGKFWIQKVEELYYLCSENKGAAQLICVFVFAYADCWFSH